MAGVRVSLPLVVSVVVSAARVDSPVPGHVCGRP